MSSFAAEVGLLALVSEGNALTVERKNVGLVEKVNTPGM